jgi:sensor domain CHASE-containing protein
VIGAVVAIILVVFYGWSQRGWLANVTDIESRDVDMQSQQLQRGFATELQDLYTAMGDYAIWTETAEFARGNRPDYFSKSLNAAALVRLDIDTFLVLDRNLDTRASLALDSSAVQEYEIPPDPELLAAVKQAVTSGQLNTNTDSLSGIVQRARGPALFAVRPIFDSTGTGQPHGWLAFARAFTPAVVERMGRFSPWPVSGYPVSNLDRAGVPEEVREWVRQSPLTSNLKTRTAGHNHLNGYLILRDQVGSPIWLVQIEIPRSAYAQATRTTLYQTILLGLLVGGFTIVAFLLVARSRRLNADRLSLESRYRAIIEQAKGVLVERMGISSDEAFDHLVELSQNTNVKLVQLAATVVGSRVPTPELAAQPSGMEPTETTVPASTDVVSRTPEHEGLQAHHLLLAAQIESATTYDELAEILLSDSPGWPAPHTATISHPGRRSNCSAC